MKSCQQGVISLFLCLFGRDVSCVINSFSLSVSMTCAMRENFLYHIVWNRKCIDLCSINAFCLCDASRFRKYNTQCLSSSMSDIEGALNLKRYLTHLEVLRVSHAADHVLRLFAEWVVHVILPQFGFQRLSIWVRFELMNQLFDCFLACDLLVEL